MLHPALLLALAAITNGAPDDGDPAVVAIVKADGSVWCSGTLVGPHTVLTAAHCMIDTSNATQYRVYFGAAPAGGTGSFSDVSDGQIDPAFDPITMHNDVALLTIRQPAPTDPIAFDARTFDATLVGQTLEAVGFGVTAAGAGDQGQKRSGTASVTAVGDVDFTTAGDPSQPCTWDSGGPALFTVGGATVVGGVTSHGDAACSSYAVYARVDTAQASFIQPYLAATAPSTVSVGQRCLYAEQCSDGPCLQAADEPTLWFCSRACTHASDCPAAMVCASDGCRYPTPSPSALGASCAQPADCVSGICYAAPGMGGVCTRRCVAVGGDACPSGYACENGGDVAFYCLAARHGGCAAAPARAAPPVRAAWPLFAALAALAIGVRQRARSCSKSRI